MLEPLKFLESLLSEAALLKPDKDISKLEKSSFERQPSSNLIRIDKMWKYKKSSSQTNKKSERNGMIQRSSSQTKATGSPSREQGCHLRNNFSENVKKFFFRECHEVKKFFLENAKKFVAAFSFEKFHRPGLLKTELRD